MKARESAAEFQDRLLNEKAMPGQFNVYNIREFGTKYYPHYRRDFYKISFLTKGEGILSYGDEKFHVKDNVLALFNPLIPYAYEPLSKNDKGYFCMFTEDFINTNLNPEILSKSPLLRISGNHVLTPSPAQIIILTNIFEQMIREMESSYVYKYELLGSYLQVIIYEALKITPFEQERLKGNSSTRLCEMFFSILERQFPISSPQHSIRFKHPNEFAEKLAVHTNHLNKTIKAVTGKTTSEYIAERIIREAKALLSTTNWDIAEISYCLAFDHASNFNTFFKKHTGQTPNQFRRQD